MLRGALSVSAPQLATCLDFHLCMRKALGVQLQAGLADLNHESWIVCI